MIASRLEPRIALDRRRPGDRPAPVVADQREPLQFQRVGQREQVGQQRLGRVGLDLLRPVAVAEPALVGHDQPQLVRQQGHQLAPGAVRFREAVQQDHRRRVFRPGQRDIHA